MQHRQADVMECREKQKGSRAPRFEKPLQIMRCFLRQEDYNNTVLQRNFTAAYDSNREEYPLKWNNGRRMIAILSLTTAFLVVLAGCRTQPLPEESTAPVESQIAETPEESTPAPVETEPETVVRTSFEDVTAIGDSVMLGAKVEMENRMPGCVVDADESRQIWDGKEVAEGLEAEGKLGDTIVLALGTNCTFTKDTARELLDYLGTERTIYWVTAYGEKLSWQDEVNATMEAVSEEYDNVHLLRWDEVGPQHPEWFYGDGLHLNGEGRIGYAEFLKENLMEGPTEGS